MNGGFIVKAASTRSVTGLCMYMLGKKYQKVNYTKPVGLKKKTEAFARVKYKLDTAQTDGECIKLRVASIYIRPATTYRSWIYNIVAKKMMGNKTLNLLYPFRC